MIGRVPSYWLYFKPITQIFLFCENVKEKLSIKNCTLATGISNFPILKTKYLKTHCIVYVNQVLFFMKKNTGKAGLAANE